MRRYNRRPAEMNYSRPALTRLCSQDPNLKTQYDVSLFMTSYNISYSQLIFRFKTQTLNIQHPQQ